MGRLLLLASSFLWSFALLNCSLEQKKLGVSAEIKKIWDGLFDLLVQIDLEKNLQLKLTSKHKTAIVDLFCKMQETQKDCSFSDLKILIIQYIRRKFPYSTISSEEVARVLCAWPKADGLGLIKDAAFLEECSIVNSVAVMRIDYKDSLSLWSYLLRHIELMLKKDSRLLDVQPSLQMSTAWKKNAETLLQEQLHSEQILNLDDCALFCQQILFENFEYTIAFDKIKKIIENWKQHQKISDFQPYALFYYQQAREKEDVSDTETGTFFNFRPVDQKLIEEKRNLRKKYVPYVQVRNLINDYLYKEYCQRVACEEECKQLYNKLRKNFDDEKLAKRIKALEVKDNVSWSKEIEETLLDECFTEVLES